MNHENKSEQNIRKRKSASEDIKLYADIYDMTGHQLQQINPALETECLGGGRIEHSPDEKKIKVYGYSQGFGKADHKVTVDILKKKYTDYDITWSDEGY